MRHPRPRRSVSHTTIVLLAPVFRYSATRDAYIMRLRGGTMGPVLVPRARRIDRHERRSAA